VPGGLQGDALGLGDLAQVLDLAQRRAGRLFQHHVLAGLQRLAGQAVAHLRRGAQGDGVERHAAGQQVVESVEAGQAGLLGVAADDGDQLEARIGGHGRQVLVASDLAQADQGHADGGGVGHGASRLLETLFVG
jgi:hypothetical protein